MSFATILTPSQEKLSQGNEHKECSTMLHKALEDAVMLNTFPRAAVDVFALMLESGGVTKLIGLAMI